jgi:hypothetical protein
LFLLKEQPVGFKEKKESVTSYKATLYINSI